MKKFPTLFKDQNLPAKSEQRALSRQEKFEQTAAAMRRAVGKSEIREMPRICSKTGKHYVVVFERESPDQKFRLLRIDKVEDTSQKNAVFGKGGSGSGSDLIQYKYSAFDHSGVNCPWCGNTRIVNCGRCGYSVCGATIRKTSNGEETFRCHDACGSTGTLIPGDHMMGSRGARASLPMNAKADAKSLPKPQRAALPGPQKRLPPGTGKR